MTGIAAQPVSRGWVRARRALVIGAAAAALTASAVLICGCGLQVGLDTTVKADGSGTIGIKVAADKELQDMLQQGGAGGGNLGSLLQGLREKLPANVDALFLMVLGNIPSDWSVDRGTDDDGTKWISATRSFTSPDDLKQILTGGVLGSWVDKDKFLLSQEKGFFCTKTVFSTTAEPGKALEKAQANESGVPVELLGRVLSIQNRVTLPGAIKKNNADEIQGNTLVWRVGTSGSLEMYAESEMYRWDRIIGIAAAAFVALVALLVLLWLLLRRRRRRDRAEAPQPPAPPAEAPPAVAEVPPVETPPAEAPSAVAEAPPVPTEAPPEGDS